MVKCPKCHSAKVAPIMYGMPSYEGFQEAERGEVILGGCIVMPGQPDYGCLDCKHQWSKESMPATAITKVRFKCWENGPGFVDDMQRWVYEVYPDEKMLCYTYRGQSRKCESKEEASCSANKALEFYRQLKKAVFADPSEIISCEVCDGCSYQLQISFCDGRKEIVDGDIGAGTIDDMVLKFLHKKFEVL